MATTDEKILQALESLQEGQAKLEKSQAQTNEQLQRLEDGQARLITAGEALKAGLDDLREHMATKADVLDVKAAVLHLGVKLDKYQRQNEARLDNLEEKTSTHNPTKN